VITPEAAREALLRSGYLLESRIEALFRRRAYYVQANSVFLDRTASTRELDVYALGAIKAGPQDRDFLFTAFLIECVNDGCLVDSTYSARSSLSYRSGVQVARVCRAPPSASSGRRDGAG
jgi:hypothetical protein